MAGLPKKYAQMGFKKGWKAFKATKRKSSSRSTAVRKTIKKRSVTTMARRRSLRVKTRRSSRKGMSATTKALVGGAAYGVLREPLNGLAAKVPLVGQFGDEVALLGASWVIAKYGKGALKSVGYAGMAIEAHNLARNFSLGGLLGGSSKSSTNGSGATF